ncbi:MAG: hypothetical protein CMJ64_07930 [Planctomycetaceae bacterium]|nr:hypothetical protein [Planctomycetaceae bacterium]
MQTADVASVVMDQFVGKSRLTNRDRFDRMIELQLEIDLALRDDRAATHALARLLARRGMAWMHGRLLRLLILRAIGARWASSLWLFKLLHIVSAANLKLTRQGTGECSER